MLVLVEAAAVAVVVECCDERNDFTPAEMFYVTGALCRFERFIPANAFMTVGERLRLLVANMKYAEGDWSVLRSMECCWSGRTASVFKQHRFLCLHNSCVQQCSSATLNLAN